MLKDAIADFLEAASSVTLDFVTIDFVRTNDHAQKLHTLIALSAGLQSDKLLAWQATRKLV
jgi:hypothetical protein|eukprot:COSAG02_NODE_2221_length_9469_cov_3.478975_8_plen_61_part_00